MKVTVYDLCVYNRDPPTATIFVSGVGSVELSVTEKVRTAKYSYRKQSAEYSYCKQSAEYNYRKI